MDHRTSYTCKPCGAVHGVTVSDLPDPKHDYSPSLVASIERHDMALQILDQSAQSELLYATCPRCGARNPDGVAALSKDLRNTRIGAVVGATFVALGAWVLPGIAWLVVTIVVALTIVRIAALRRARRLGFAVLYDVALSVGVFALAVYAPPFTAVVPIIVAVQSFRARRNDMKFDDAKKKVRFDLPYR